MTTALYAGSFDPVTYGHINLIERGVRLFDKVVVGVAVNVNKTPTFSTDERIAMLSDSISQLDKVEVCHFEGLLVNFAEEIGAEVLMRGLRATGDFESEFQMAHMNRRLAPGLETVFLATGDEHFYVSSRLVREVASFGGKVSGLVPPHVEAKLKKRFSK